MQKHFVYLFHIFIYIFQTKQAGWVWLCQRRVCLWSGLFYSTESQHEVVAVVVITDKFKDVLRCSSWSLNSELHLETLLWFKVFNVAAARSQRRSKGFSVFLNRRVPHSGEPKSEEVHWKKLSKWNFDSLESLRFRLHHKAAAALC